MLRVHAQAELDPGPSLERSPRQRPEALPLRERIEDHVVRDVQDLGQVAFGVRRREGVHFPAELLPAEPRLVEAARAGAVEVARDQRREAPHREGLQREQDPRAARLLHLREDAQVLLDRRLVDDVAGRRHPPRVEPPEPLGAHRLFHRPVGLHHRPRQAVDGSWPP
jgi:hypothetical protein